eukprot:jgi/Tetstr1/421878/TSEL_012778.t1
MAAWAGAGRDGAPGGGVLGGRGPASGRGLRPRGALPTRMAAAAASDPPKYAILTYDYVPDILEKRGPYRAEHLAAAQKLKDEGKLMAAGALLDPEAEEFAKNDPYVKAGLVPSWKVRQYMAAIH